MTIYSHIEFYVILEIFVNINLLDVFNIYNSNTNATTFLAEKIPNIGDTF